MTEIMVRDQPEPCMAKAGRRERNFSDDGVPSPAGQQEWRQDAARRKAKAKQQ